MLLRARERGSRAASACLRNPACRGRSSRGIRLLRTGNREGGRGNRRRSVLQLRRQRRGRTAPTACRTRTLPKRADSMTPSRPSQTRHCQPVGDRRPAGAGSSRSASTTRHIGPPTARSARAAMLIFAPIRLTVPAARVSFTARNVERRFAGEHARKAPPWRGSQRRGPWPILAELD